MASSAAARNQLEAALSEHRERLEKIATDLLHCDRRCSTAVAELQQLVTGPQGLTAVDSALQELHRRADDVEAAMDQSRNALHAEFSSMVGRMRVMEDSISKQLDSTVDEERSARSTQLQALQDRVELTIQGLDGKVAEEQQSREALSALVVSSVSQCKQEASTRLQDAVARWGSEKQDLSREIRRSLEEGLADEREARRVDIGKVTNLQENLQEKLNLALKEAQASRRVAATPRGTLQAGLEATPGLGASERTLPPTTPRR
mmetsp:Transcript_48555/g.105779  ORF Transcript_48555/g.105779 Transcript_48555/m.105779 type:complete len:262 (+) Transcript_48555:3-788(+)